jgi:ribokinase
VVGDTAFDHYLQLGPPSTDEKAHLEHAARALGGTGANAAIAAARAGVEVTLATTLGDDPIGSWLAERLDASGIAHVLGHVEPGGSMIATIVVEDGSRRVIVDPGVGAQLLLPDERTLDSFHAMYVTFAPNVALELLAARPAGAVVIGAEHWMFQDADFSSAVLDADVVVTNEAGWDAWRPGSLRSAVVVTRGSHGATLFRHDGTETEFPALRVATVDATGAGDAFAGCLVAALARGDGLDDAVQQAVVAGALATMHWGAHRTLDAG